MEIEIGIAAGCVNHPARPATHNSIYGPGQPLCLTCATHEAEVRNG